MNRFRIFSKWAWELWRKGKLIDHWVEGNLCTDEGLNYVLDVAFSAGTAITAWYCLIFENNHTPAAGNTYATPGFTESTAYSETNRPAWTDGGVSAKTVSNSASKASFTMNASKTIYGGALVGGGTAPNTKGDSAGGGKLYNVSQFTGGAKSVILNDVLQVTISFTIADA